ncbi:MAG: hypothetical protein Rubg2KO_15440 [Rubricoccaceae bacterium]
MSVAQVLAENATRVAAIRTRWDAYDPLAEVWDGSPTPRTFIPWDDASKPLGIPTRMMEAPSLDPDGRDDGRGGDALWGPWLRMARDTGMPLGTLIQQQRQLYADRQLEGNFDVLTWSAFREARTAYDYEYWCAWCVTIEDFDTGELHPLILRPAQRDSFWAREEVRLAGRPVRQVEVKGRRYGSTTEKRAYVAWLQNRVYAKAGQRRHAFLISLDKGGTTAEIARGYEILCKHHPGWAGTLTLANVRNSQTSREVTETGCLVGIASVNNPQGASGFAAHFAMFSEMGKMASNEVQSADRLVTNVTSILGQRAGTVCMMESTGERAGKLFKRYVEQAQERKGSWDFHFTRWDADPNCWVDLTRSNLVERSEGETQDEKLAAWIESWMGTEHSPGEPGEIGERLRMLWDEGCCLEQVAFFELVAREKPSFGDALQEFPWTPAEAFQYGLRRRYPAPHVHAVRKTCRPPVRGVLVADETTGMGALRGIRFVPDRRGELRLWHPPPGITIEGCEPTPCPLVKPPPYRYTNPFVVSMDIGGTWERSDFTTMPVLDRRPLAHGLPPVVAAAWHGRLDADLAAWQAARLAMWYQQALLAVEVNSLKEDKGDPDEGLEPDHGLTVLDEIQSSYTMLYRRKVYDRRTDEWTEKLGYHMNVATKPLVTDTLGRYLRESHDELVGEGEGGGYVEREVEACAEMDSYVRMDNGGLAASPGEKDDRVMARAILLRVSDEMERPVPIDPGQAERNRKARQRAATAAASV